MGCRTGKLWAAEGGNALKRRQQEKTGGKNIRWSRPGSVPFGFMCPLCLRRRVKRQRRPGFPTRSEDPGRRCRLTRRGGNVEPYGPSFNWDHTPRAHRGRSPPKSFSRTRNEASVTVTFHTPFSPLRPSRNLSYDYPKIGVIAGFGPALRRWAPQRNPSSWTFHARCRFHRAVVNIPTPNRLKRRTWRRASRKILPGIMLHRFRQLADAMPQMVWVARADGFFEYFNQRLVQSTPASRPPNRAGMRGWACSIPMTGRKSSGVGNTMRSQPNNRTKSNHACTSRVRRKLPLAPVPGIGTAG